MNHVNRTRIELVSFLVLGFTNNFHYLMIMMASQNIVNSFEVSHLISVFFLILTASGLVSQFSNMLFVSIIKEYRHKMFLVIILDFFGIACLALSASIDVGNKNGFLITLFGISLISASSCIGEAVALSYTKFFSPNCIQMWHFGFGFAAIFSSICYISSVYIEIRHFYMVLIVSFTIPIHAIVFYCILERIKKTSVQWTQTPIKGEEKAVTGTFVLISEEDEMKEEQEMNENWKSTGESELEQKVMLLKTENKTNANGIINTLKNMCPYIPNTLFICYIEEIILIGFAGDVFLKEEYRYWIVKNSFSVFAACYSIGGILGTAAALFPRFDVHGKLSRIILMQLANAVFWFFQWRYKFVTRFVGIGVGFSVLFVSMCFVGFFFSLCYISSFNHMKRVFLEEKPFSGSENYCDTAINITTMGMSAISIFSSFSCFVLTNLIFKNQFISSS